MSDSDELMLAAHAAAVDARSVATDLPYYDRNEVLAGVVHVLAAAGDAAAALDTAAAVRNPYRRLIALTGAAFVLAEAGDVLAAKDMAAALDGTTSRVGALVAIVEALSSVGDLAGTREAAVNAQAAINTSGDADTVNISLVRFFELRRVVKALSAVGDLAAARGAAAEAKVAADASDSGEAAVGIVHTLAVAGDVPAAWAAATAIEYPRNRASALCGLSQVLSSAGDASAAREAAAAAWATADAMGHVHGKTEALCKVARALSSAGDASAAREAAAAAWASANEIRDLDVRSSLLVEVAETLAVLGDAAAAQAAVDSIWNSEHEDRARSKVAKALAATGDARAARAIVDAIDDPAWRSEVLVAVAEALAAVGEAPAARAVADDIDDSEYRVSALIRVARALAAAGRPAPARQVAAAAVRAITDAAEDPAKRSRALSEVARVLVDAGDAPSALVAATAARISADTISDPRDRASAMVVVAGTLAMAETGQGDRAATAAARAAADSIADPPNRARALCRVAKALTFASKAAKAREAGDAVVHSDSLVETLGAILRGPSSPAETMPLPTAMPTPVPQQFGPASTATSTPGTPSAYDDVPRPSVPARHGASPSGSPAGTPNGVPETLPPRLPQMIAWPGLCEPGEARLVDPTVLLSSGFILNGEPFYDRTTVKSLIDKGLTLMHHDQAGFAIATLNACIVDSVAAAAVGDTTRAYATLASTDALEEHLMSLVPRESSQGPWASVVLAVLNYNMLATASTFEESARDDLLEWLANDVAEIKKTRAHLERTQGSGTALDQRRRELELQFLDRIARDVALVLSSARKLQPASLQVTGIEQVSHFRATGKMTAGQQKGGCYVATAVYGSYDCPEVWVLRRWRDNQLASMKMGRQFIRLYYRVSPAVVRTVGGWNWFTNLVRRPLDILVDRLAASGYSSLPYSDR